MASALFHPDFKAAPYWWETWRPNADGSADPPARADVAIVGAGYGGLAAALELRRAGTAVVVMEANEFVSGASSRNGDAVSGGINLGNGLLGRRTADQGKLARQAAAMLREEADSLLLLEEIITHAARAHLLPHVT
jgi:glycine/D-amino acid oxidase-like deaminating enzyme